MSTNFTSYALLGSGRVSRHLAFYFASLDLPFKTWSRRDNAPHELAAVVAPASHILFAVRDDAIAELAQPFLESGKTLVHFSGALQSKGVHAAHPLMTFGNELEEPDWYPLIPFVIDHGMAFKDLLPGLPNRAWPLEGKLRPLYHSLCALSGNSAFLLWRAIGDEFERELGLPRHLLQAFLYQTVTNSMHGDGNFTGPVARGDWQTVERHLAALAQYPELLKAYRSFLTLAKDTGHSIPEALL